MHPLKRQLLFSCWVLLFNVTSIPTGTTIANLRLQSDEASVEIKADNNGKIASADLQALIEKQYGKGAIMKLGEGASQQVEVIL